MVFHSLLLQGPCLSHKSQYSLCSVQSVFIKKVFTAFMACSVLFLQSSASPFGNHLLRKPKNGQPAGHHNLSKALEFSEIQRTQVSLNEFGPNCKQFLQQFCMTLKLKQVFSTLRCDKTEKNYLFLGDKLLLVKFLHSGLQGILCINEEYHAAQPLDDLSKKLMEEIDSFSKTVCFSRVSMQQLKSLKLKKDVKGLMSEYCEQFVQLRNVEQLKAPYTVAHVMCKLLSISQNFCPQISTTAQRTSSGIMDDGNLVKADKRKKRKVEGQQKLSRKESTVDADSSHYSQFLKPSTDVRKATSKNLTSSAEYLESEASTPNWNNTEFQKIMAELELKRMLSRNSHWAYLCVTSLLCITMWCVWYLRGFHSRPAKKREITFHDDTLHMLTVKEVLWRKRKYLPMFYRDDGLEEVFVHDCGTDP